MTPLVGWIIGTVIFVLLLVALVGFLGTPQTSTSVEVGPAVSVDMELEQDSSTGVVLSTVQTKRPFSTFGLDFGSREWQASVAIAAPEGCAAVTDEELVAEGPCADVPVTGEVNGGGTLPDGRDLIIVAVRISEECFASLPPGSRWPSEIAACQAR